MNISREEAQRIYEEQSAYVFRLALFLTKSRMLSEDIVQDTFIQVFQNYSQYDAARPIQPWIYQITLNTVRKALRKRQWSQLWNGQLKSETVEELVVKEEQHQELWDEVNHLSFKSKEIIFLHYYLELKLTEIAEILDIPIGTCKSRLHTALKSLRRKMPNGDFNIQTYKEFGG